MTIVQQKHHVVFCKLCCQLVKGFMSQFICDCTLFMWPYSIHVTILHPWVLHTIYRALHWERCHNVCANCQDLDQHEHLLLLNVGWSKSVLTFPYGSWLSSLCYMLEFTCTIKLIYQTENCLIDFLSGNSYSKIWKV